MTPTDTAFPSQDQPLAPARWSQLRAQDLPRPMPLLKEPEYAA
ncbi:MAG: hypothetical protein AB3N15_06055 [Paracoccaceae bacterium]